MVETRLEKDCWGRRAGAAFVAALFTGAVLAGILLGYPRVAVADEEGHAHDPTNIWTIARGGQLYDNWMSVLEADQPQQTHPAYPAAGKKKGTSTWRCKECHGWDYRGAEGAYSAGSHFTGIKGVRGVAGKDPETIHETIMNKTHGFTEAMMPHSAMEKLAIFLSGGQLEMDRYIDRASKASRGDSHRGAAAYQTICAVCHGFDGKEINFKDENKPEFVGTICRENPWEALHKIRFGQPGVGMVAMASMDVEYQVDILAYCQTLPEK